MTFVYENDLDILQMYLHTKNKHSRSRLSEVRALQTDRQTDTEQDATDNIITPRSWVVKINDAVTVKF